MLQACRLPALFALSQTVRALRPSAYCTFARMVQTDFAFAGGALKNAIMASRLFAYGAKRQVALQTDHAFAHRAFELARPASGMPVDAH